MMKNLFRKSKRQRGEGSSLQAQVDSKYDQVSSRQVLPTRWADDQFLTPHGLRADFDLMCANAGIPLLAYADHPTFTELTWEFLASFQDDFKEKGNQCMVSFTINHQYQELSFIDFCDAFGFPHEGETIITNAYSVACSDTWEAISVHGGRTFYQKKMTTIQNSTIRYFTMFLANTLLGRGDMDSMANADMAMITKALFPDVPNSPNPAALLIQHFRHQSNKTKGDIRIGGLVTHLAIARGLTLPIAQPVDGYKLMDSKYLIACGYLGKYRVNPRLRVFQFGYVAGSNDE